MTNEVDAQITEKKLLEFKALTMSPGVFRQLRMARPEDVGEKGSYEDKFIGHVLDTDGGAWFIGKGSGTLLRVRRVDLWDWMLSAKTGLAKVADIVVAIDELRDMLPQIFLK